MTVIIHLGHSTVHKHKQVMIRNGGGGAQAFRDHSGILTGKVTWKVGIENDG